MGAQTEHFDTKGREMVMARRAINGNTYLVLVYPNEPKQQVIVYTDPTGADHGFPDHPYMIADEPYEEIHRDSQRKHRSETPPIETFASRVINEAVCKLEDKQRERETLARKVEAALEANKETHEGLDYHLDIDKSD